MNQHLRIKDWAVDDRPREKLLKKGIASLSDAELVAILIGTGSHVETAVELAKKVLNSVNNNLHSLSKLTIHDLTKIKGIGKVKAISILAAMELGKRRNHTDINERNKITSSQDAFEYFNPILLDLVHEEFWVVYLNRSNSIIDRTKISQGGLSGTVTDVRLIMKTAIELLASSIILAHNHPSGNTAPSEADLAITKKLKQTGELMDVKVLDHIIIADNKYYSLADSGLI